MFFVYLELNTAEARSKRREWEVGWRGRTQEKISEKKGEMLLTFF